MDDTGGRTTYTDAFRVSIAKLRRQDPEFAAKQTGVTYDKERGIFVIESLGKEIHITFPEGRVVFADSEKLLPRDWSLITLNYLSRGDGRPLTGKLISYRELDAGDVFYPNLKQKVIERLAKDFGSKKPAEIQDIFTKYKSTPAEGCDIGGVLHLFPRFPITVKLWLADEEFPPSANVLFDSSAGGYLHTEDVAAAAYIIGDALCSPRKYKLG